MKSLRSWTFANTALVTLSIGELEDMNEFSIKSRRAHGSIKRLLFQYETIFYSGLIDIKGGFLE
jgi:hypothetical protein